MKVINALGRLTEHEQVMAILRPLAPMPHPRPILTACIRLVGLDPSDFGADDLDQLSSRLTPVLLDQAA